mmetsp:Transcript_21544/g.59256  ORF Transcript_21544/g.59256 Transcript_21544/m.59256 type:complete len:108 (-) Transcript_21544:146-469(-)
MSRRNRLWKILSPPCPRVAQARRILQVESFSRAAHVFSFSLFFSSARALSRLRAHLLPISNTVSLSLVRMCMLCVADVTRSPLTTVWGFLLSLLFIREPSLGCAVDE